MSHHLLHTHYEDRENITSWFSG
ncbi:MAG: hypothetical protein ACLTBV_33395 [Enterocloster bolteae]